MKVMAAGVTLLFFEKGFLLPVFLSVWVLLDFLKKVNESMNVGVFFPQILRKN